MIKAIDCFDNLKNRIYKTETIKQNKVKEDTQFVIYIKNNYEYFNDLNEKSTFLKIIKDNTNYVSETEYKNNKDYYDDLFSEFLNAINEIYDIPNFHNEIITEEIDDFMENDYGEIIELPKIINKKIKHVYETKKEYKDKLEYYYNDYFKSLKFFGNFDYLNNQAKREWLSKDYYDSVDKYDFSGAECLAYRNSFIKDIDEEGNYIYKKNSYWDKQYFFN
jgi:hypothetical protein